MEIRKFRNLDELYESICKGSLYHDWIWVGDDFQLHYTSTKPALFYKGEIIAHSLKDINREMRFYGLTFKFDRIN